MEPHAPHDSDVLARERQLRLNAEALCEALRDSERRYQDLVDRLPAALYTCDASGHVQTFNAAAVALWGRTPVAGQDVWCGSYRIYRPDGSPLPLAECPMAVTLRERRPVVGEEIVIERPDGERRAVLPHPQPVFSPSGELVGAVNMLVDVSDLKTTRSALASTRDVLAAQVHTLTRLHALSMFLGSGFDLRIGLQAVVDTFVELHGADRGLLTLYDEASGLLFPAASAGFGTETLLILGQISPGLPANVCGRAFTSGQRAVVEDVQADAEFAAAGPIARMAGFRGVHSVPILRRSGGTIGVLSAFFAASRLPSDAERQVADICALHAADAVEAARSRQALQESEERFRHMADHAPVLIWVMGLGGCEFANQEFIRFVGATQDEIRGEGWKRFLHPADAGFLADCLSAPERTPFCAQTRVLRKDGCYRWVRSAGTPRLADDGTFLGYVGCAVDITDMKESEAALRQADRRKDEFLATLAHELRNPLASIRNALHLLRLTANGPETGRVHELISRQVDLVVRLVDDLTEVSRITRGRIDLRRERVDLSGIIRVAIETVQPQLDGHRLSVSLPADPIPLDADPARLVQVFANLLGNAAKYTPAGGHIWLTAARQGGDVIVSVADTGIGLSPEMLPQVFDLFVQGADGSRDRGLGTGLTLVRDLIEMHGGRVEAASQGPGQGAHFRVSLPIARTAPAERPGAGGPAGGGAPIAGRRVLVVDDNHDGADTLGMMLQALGAEVTVLYDGPAALEHVVDHRPEIVLLDIGMPGMSGYEVAGEIRRRVTEVGHVILIALTGWGQEEDRRRSTEAGFDYHLVKPLQFETLQSVLTSVMARVRPNLRQA